MLIFYPKPTTLQELINLAIACDNRLLEAKAETQAARTHFAPRQLPPNDAMEVDSIKARHHAASPAVLPVPAPASISVPNVPTASPIAAASTRTLTTRRGPLTPEERAHRIAQGLCLYCGLSGHLIAACPTKPVFQLRQ